MSILKVDTINEKTSGNGVAIPGHVIQVKQTVVKDTFSTAVGQGFAEVWRAIHFGWVAIA